MIIKYIAFVNENNNDIYTYKDIIKYITKISDNPVTDVPDYFFTLLKKDKPKFILKEINIEELLQQDPDLKEYVDSDNDRYEDSDYEPHWKELNNPIVIFNDEVIDGYNRTGVKYRNGEETIDAYVSI